MKVYPNEIPRLLLGPGHSSSCGEAVVASGGHVDSIGRLEHFAAGKWSIGFDSSSDVLPDPRRDWSLRFPTLTRDMSLAGILGLLNLVIFWPEDSQSLMAALVMTLAAFGALAYRTRIPLTAFLIAASASLLTTLLLPEYTLTLAIGIALYTVTSWRSRRLAVSCLILALILEALWIVRGVEGAGRTATTEVMTITAVACGCVAFAAFAFGLWSSSNRRLMEEREYRDELEVKEAIAADRERIAADFHDGLAHAITGIILQSAGARDVAGHDGQGVQRSLDNIEATARQAMGELRRLLDPVDVLKTDWEPERDTPYLGISAVQSLVDSLTDAGHTVRVTSAGNVRKLGATTDLVAYRVIQEALTNVAKHGPAHAQVDLNIQWGAEALAINITNTAASHRPGRELSECRGLIGMQRRVELVHGDLKFSVTAEGAYEVEVHLPIQQRR